MLPLLTYKVFRYKRDKFKTGCNESVIEPEQKINIRHPCKCNKNRKKKKLSYLELFILLFGMFGVPLSYMVYWNVSRLYKWGFGDSSDNAVIIDEMHSPLTSVPLSLRSVIYERLRNMEKYSFNYSWTEVDRRSGLSQEEFHDMYSGKWPVIITDCGNKWPAFKKWNKDYFLSHHGQELVTVKTAADGVQETFVMPLNVYLGHIDEGYPHQWTYLNDEIFIPSRPHLDDDIGTCKELEEDFFQLFPIEVRPWWAFLLWGTRYSRSDLHIDPFNWTGTNMVISGLKRWKLFPPGQDHLLHVIPNQQYKFPMNFNKYNSYVDCYNHNHIQQYPSVTLAKVLEFYQYPGELLIIPSGWFHQAFNEEATLAVSGQIMNRDNYRYVLEELFKGGEVPRDETNEIDTGNRDPAEEVRKVLSKISKETRKNGREITMTIYEQLKQLAKSSGLPRPPLFFDRFKDQ